MIKWEYLEVVVMFASDVHEGEVVSRITTNGKTIFDDRKKPSYLFGYFNQLGKDGWELIIRDHNKFYFKRPLESEI
jgi:hypothetical protein